ncbi:MAG: phage terminase large subunit [Clostridia bacterium]|nr:phage terminase large subunit [Clostridia bacterium]
MKDKALTDTQLFGSVYLPHYFSLKAPSFHRELSKLWHKNIMKTDDVTRSLTMKGSRLVIAAPRGHAKSTVMSLQNVLHAALYGYKKYILLISDTESQAVSFLDCIKCELEDNEKIIEDFGNMKGKIWKSSSIVLANGCRIEALGSGQKIRGRRNAERRPDLIILDDIENDEDVRSPEQRRKLEGWFFSAVSKAGDYYTDILLIGTVLHKDSLLSNLLKNPIYTSRIYKAVISFSPSEKWQVWENMLCNVSDDDRMKKARRYFALNKAEMLRGTKVLWKEKLPYDELMLMKLSDGEAAFNTEMQNSPIDRSTALFPQGWFSYYNPFDEDFSNGDYDFYGYCDPSLGKSMSSDFSAIITIAKNRKNGIFYVENADIMRRHPDRIINDIIENAKRIGREYNKKFISFGIETNQFQWMLKEELAKESAKAGLYLPINEVNSTGDKTLRIQSLQPFIKNGYVRFQQNQTLLLEQLWDFPYGAHDDGPDALEGCLKLAKKEGMKAVKGLII